SRSRIRHGIVSTKFSESSKATTSISRSSQTRTRFKSSRHRAGSFRYKLKKHSTQAPGFSRFGKPAMMSKTSSMELRHSVAIRFNAFCPSVPIRSVVFFTIKTESQLQKRSSLPAQIKTADIRIRITTVSRGKPKRDYFGSKSPHQSSALVAGKVDSYCTCLSTLNTTVCGACRRHSPLTESEVCQ